MFHRWALNLSVILLLVGCGSSQDPLVGKWRDVEKDMKFEFRADGAILLEDGANAGSWSLPGL